MRSDRRQRGSVLLEVLITVTIIAMFMGMIGAQILSAVRASRVIERKQAAIFLAESLAARLQAGALDLTQQAERMSGDFGAAYPGWGYRIEMEPTEDQTLVHVHLQILQGEPEQARLSLDSLAPVLDLYTLWAIPPKIDLVADYGLSEEQAAELANLGGGLAGMDPYNFDPRMLASLDLTQLQEMLPQLLPLLSQFGGSELARSAGGSESLDLSGLEDLLAQAGERGGAGQAGQQDQQTGQDQQNPQGGFSMDELTRLLNSGDKQGAINYILEHQEELRAGAAGGRGGGSRGRGSRSGDEGQVAPPAPDTGQPPPEGQGRGPRRGRAGRGGEQDQVAPSAPDASQPPQDDQDRQPRRGRGGRGTGRGR